MAQKTNICTNFKSGQFYSYPMNTADQYVMYRTDGLQKDLNVKTGDSIIWKLDWSNDCTYSLKYMSGSKMKKDVLDILKKYTFIYEIIQSHSDYYVFKAYLDSRKNLPVQTDTVWLKEKAVSPNHLLFTLTEPNAIRRTRFSDISSYALVYIYRPKKTACFGAESMLYANDQALCVMPNNSRYVFKIYKEGPLRIFAKHATKEDTTEINIRFGQKYYLGALMKWGAYCSPVLTLEKEETGKLEFDNIY